MIVMAPISVGELIDKITILSIKAERIADPTKQANVVNELVKLKEIQAELRLPDLGDLYKQLYFVNSELWFIEDSKRQCEKDQNFGPDFIEHARNVYKNNDLRAKIKNEINKLVGSTIIEEKSY